MCMQIHIVYTMYTTQLMWAEGGGGSCLQGLLYYFPHFWQFPYSKRCSSNNRSDIKDQNPV